MSHTTSGFRASQLLRKALFLGSLGAIAGGVLTPATARAQQDTFYLDRAQLSGAPDDGFVMFRPYLHEKTRLYGALGLGYTLNPLRASSMTDDVGVQQDLEDVVDHQLTTYANFGVEVMGRFSLGAALPITLFQSGTDPSNQGVGDNQLSLSGQALQDFRLNTKIKVFQSNNRKFNFGIGGAVWIPTGNAKSFGSDDQTTGWLYGAGEYDVGKFQIAALLGPQFRPLRGYLGPNGQLQVGTEIRWGAAAFVPLRDGKIRLGGNIWGTAGLDSGSTVGRNFDAEWLAEGRFAITKDGTWYASGGAGTRLATTGYGSPDVRVLAMIGTWTTLGDVEPGKRSHAYRQAPDVEMKDKDTDGDGYPDDIDQCPTEPEDHKPPNKSDGCPATVDRDYDGIPDAVDKCPDDPEDKDGILDEDGCPEKDADNDGVPDKEDACPLMPGERNKDPKKNGCKKREHLVETKSGLELLETIQFDTAKATIKPQSFPILDEVVSVLNDGPDVKMGVYGHTDNRGARAMNLNLSKARAASVMQYLIDKGIKAARLKSDGFGPDKPVDTNDTDAGRQKNRRVEFKVLE